MLEVVAEVWKRHIGLSIDSTTCPLLRSSRGANNTLHNPRSSREANNASHDPGSRRVPRPPLNIHRHSTPYLMAYLSDLMEPRLMDRPANQQSAMV